MNSSVTDVVRQTEEREVVGWIYSIRNKVNNKIYIGQTVLGFDKTYRNLENTRGTRINRWLKEDIKLYGIENFEITKELDFAYTLEELNEKEMFYIKKYKDEDEDCLYNRLIGGMNTAGKRHYDLYNEEKPKKERIVNPRTCPVICLTTYEVFKTIIDASEKYNIGNQNITACCKGKLQSAGKHKSNLEKMVWEYYDVNKIYYDDIQWADGEEYFYEKEDTFETVKNIPINIEMIGDKMKIII